MATLAELEAALRKAHAAGNADHARAFAAAIRQMRSQANAGGVTRSPQEWADAENLPIPGTEWNTPEQPARFQSPIPGGDFMNEAARTFAENIPIVGPLVDRGAQAAGSQLASMIPGVDMTPDQLQQQRDVLRARDAADQPIANAAGTVTGTVGPLMSLGTTKLGQQALGMVGPWFQRMAAGALSGGTIAAADAAARGESTNDEVAGQFGLGFGLGAAFPLAERTFGAVARALFASDADRAASTLATGLERDGVDPRALEQMMRGPDGKIIDAGNNVARQGAGIATLPGEGQTILREGMVERNLGTNARIQSDADAILGPAPIPSRVRAEIDANRKALSPYYDQALENASAVETDNIALTLDSMIVNERGAAQAEARKIREMLNVTGTDQLDPNPRTLLNTRHAIDGILYTDGALAPLDSNVKRVLQTARRQIDEELAAKVPGIKEVDARYSELASQAKGVETGGTVLDGGRNTVIRPAEMVDALTEGAAIIGPSGVPFRISQGTRAEIDRLIGTTGNDVNALKTALKGDGSWNRDKLAQLYGQDKADQLIDLLDREQAYQRSYNTVMSGSDTAAKLAGQRDVAPAQFGERPIGVMDLLFAVPQKVANTAARTRSEAVNAQIAEMLMSNPTPEIVDRLIAARAANVGRVGSAPVPLLVNQ